MQASELIAAAAAVLLSLTVFAGEHATAVELPGTNDAVSQALLLEYLTDDSVFALVDARTPVEFDAAHIVGAINLPHDADDAALSILPDDRDAVIVVYCRTGKRAAMLREKLLHAGYTNVRVLQPTQIVWFDGMAVFNCAVDAGNTPVELFDKHIMKGKRE